MTIEDIEGVIRVERQFLSTATNVWAKRPCDRADPRDGEKVDDYSRRIAELEFVEGRKTVNITLV